VSQSRDATDCTWDSHTSIHREYLYHDYRWLGKIVGNIIKRDYVTMKLAVSHWAKEDGSVEEATASSISLEKMIIETIK
jgi:hypothetical protein